MVTAAGASPGSAMPPCLATKARATPPLQPTYPDYPQLFPLAFAQPQCLARGIEAPRPSRSSVMLAEPHTYTYLIPHHASSFELLVQLHTSISSSNLSNTKAPIYQEDTYQSSPYNRAMNAQLQSQLDRVEAALNTLTESITSFNPSLTAAHDLLAADAAFQGGIEERTPLTLLSYSSPPILLTSSPPPRLPSTLRPPANTPVVVHHQRNHQRLKTLHSTASSLSTSLATSLILLASTRSSILATSAPSLPASSKTTPIRRPIPHAELLAVARNTARFAAPPAFLPPSLSAQSSAGPDVQPQPATSFASDNPNVDPLDATTNGGPGETSNGAGIAKAPPKSNPGLSILTNDESTWLDPVTRAPYLPWPSEEMLANSALARVQGWSGAAVPPDGEGTNPSAPEGANGAAAEGAGANGTGAGRENGVEGGTAGNDEDVERDGVPGTKQEGQEQAQARRESSAPAVQRAPLEAKPSVFLGLDLYDPEDD